MSYSTVAELRSKLKQITVAMQDNPIVTTNISEADLEIKTDLAGYIDFTLVPADSTDINFPVFLHQLSKYKTCEICLVYQYSAKRETTQVDDITYWKGKYDALIQLIKDGLIPLELIDGTSIAGPLVTNQTYSDPKSGIAPFFGTGENGTYETNDEKKDNEERG